MKLEYGFSEFGQDLVAMDILNSLPDKNHRILMSLLDGSTEAWVEYLLRVGLEGITDISVSILPNRIVRRTKEITCVFDGKIVNIENKRNCAWEDFNGKHYFTNHLCLSSNSEQVVRKLLANFREFIKTSGIDSLKEQTIEILPAWSEAFIHRMPDEVQAFYFPPSNIFS